MTNTTINSYQRDSADTTEFDEIFLQPTMNHNTNRNFKDYFCRYQDRCLFFRKEGGCFYKHLDQNTNENNMMVQTNAMVKSMVEQITGLCGNWFQQVNGDLRDMQEKFSIKVENCVMDINEKIEQIDVKRGTDSEEKLKCVLDQFVASNRNLSGQVNDLKSALEQCEKNNDKINSKVERLVETTESMHGELDVNMQQGKCHAEQCKENNKGVVKLNQEFVKLRKEVEKLTDISTASRIEDLIAKIDNVVEATESRHNNLNVNIDQCMEKANETNKALEKLTSKIEFIRTYISDEVDDLRSKENKSTLRRHFGSVHNNIQPFKCDKCAFASSSDWSVKKHIKDVHEVVDLRNDEMQAGELKSAIFKQDSKEINDDVKKSKENKNFDNMIHLRGIPLSQLNEYDSNICVECGYGHKPMCRIGVMCVHIHCKRQCSDSKFISTKKG